MTRNKEVDGFFAQRDLRDSIKTAFDEALNVNDVMFTPSLKRAETAQASLDQQAVQKEPRTAKNAGDWVMLNVAAPIANTIGIQPYNALGNIVNPVSRFAFDTNIMPKAPKMEQGYAPDFSPEWWTQNISAGASIALLYAGLAKGTSKLAGGSSMLATRYGLEGVAAKATVLARPQNSLLLGGTLYEGLRDPNHGETRLSNMIGAAGGLYIFGLGHKWGENMTGPKLWLTRFGTGSVGTSAQNLLSTTFSGREMTLSDLKRDIVSGGVMNLVLPPLMGMARLRNAAVKDGQQASVASEGARQPQRGLSARTSEPLGQYVVDGGAVRTGGGRTGVDTSVKVNAGAGGETGVRAVVGESVAQQRLRGVAEKTAAGEATASKYLSDVTRPDGTRVIVKHDGTTVTIKDGKSHVEYPEGHAKTQQPKVREVKPRSESVRPEPPDFSHLPLEKRPVNVGGSNAELTAREMSNFQHSPFVLDGRTFASVEGFYVWLKHSGDAAKQAHAQTLYGYEAKKFGKSSKNTTAEYNGETIVLGSAQHHALIKRAIQAKLEQHPDLARRFAETHPREIIHDLGHPEGTTRLPARDFARILTELRQDLVDGKIVTKDGPVGRLSEAAASRQMQTHSEPISDALRKLSSEPSARNHPIERYASALENSGLTVSRLVKSGADSLVFEQANGNIVKLSTRLLGQQMGNRPFDLPMVERGIVDAGGGLMLQYVIHPKALTPVTTAQLRLFKAELRKQGYELVDSGEHQLGVYNGAVKLLDPYAAQKLSR